MEITYIPYHNIDRKKWIRCLDASPYASLFATPVYLDALAGKWDALVYSDYEMIMPLIFRKKVGIHYLYQPTFLPQTGIFAATPVNDETVVAFLQKAFELFSFAEISFVHPLRVNRCTPLMKLSACNNFVLDLRPAYHSLQSNYAPAFHKSLRRLQKLALEYHIGEDAAEVTSMFQKLYPKKNTGVSAADIEKFLCAVAKMQTTGEVYIRKAYLPTGKILCAVILLRYRNRLYNMMSCVTGEGKKSEANYFLYDKIIREFAEKDMVLDLEGSDIKGIADFYRKMNPVNETYLSIRYNNLPWPINMLKGKN